MTTSDRFDLLIEKYLARSLARDERQELLELLRADTDARSEFARILLDESTFRGLNAAGVPDRDPARALPSRRVSAGRSRDRRPRPITSRPWLRVALAALLLLVAGSGAARWWEHAHAGATPRAIPGSQALAELPTISQGHGTTIRHDGGPERSLAAGDRFELGDQIRTAKGGSCVLGYHNEDTRIELSAATEMTVLDPSLGKRFHLKNGEITADVAPQPAGYSMLITTPQATIRVIGTRFMLSVESGSTRLTVTEGRVHCQATNGQALEVPGGSSAIVTESGVQASSSPEQVMPSPSAAVSAPLGDWEPLTPTASLGDWTPFSGDWSCVDGTVIGIIDVRIGRARLDSHGLVPACEISCSIRGIDCRYAEFGIHNYAGSFPIRLGTQQAWHTVHVVVRGAMATCEVDGVPVAYEGGSLATGNVGFYASSTIAGARIEISHGQIRK